MLFKFLVRTVRFPENPKLKDSYDSLTSFRLDLNTRAIHLFPKIGHARCLRIFHSTLSHVIATPKPASAA